ncbi:hypothetical protein MSAN_00916500 [Mycena sanguinolenta]|uniref:Uncharacterized protein n=1 Tax=Mycena sanguinolenta TaxID=230812 RepID=A0A8H6YXN2_9AGAR|nr:hypothetical protein MSAN_00916500 [Mycena sanguinolenta]
MLMSLDLYLELHMMTNLLWDDISKQFLTFSRASCARRLARSSISSPRRRCRTRTTPRCSSSRCAAGCGGGREEIEVAGFKEDEGLNMESGRSILSNDRFQSTPMQTLHARHLPTLFLFATLHLPLCMPLLLASSAISTDSELGGALKSYFDDVGLGIASVWTMTAVGLLRTTRKDDRALYAEVPFSSTTTHLLPLLPPTAAHPRRSELATGLSRRSERKGTCVARPCGHAACSGCFGEGLEEPCLCFPANHEWFSRKSRRLEVHGWCGITSVLINGQARRGKRRCELEVEGYEVGWVQVPILLRRC